MRFSKFQVTTLDFLILLMQGNSGNSASMDYYGKCTVKNNLRAVKYLHVLKVVISYFQIVAIKVLGI